MTNKELWAKLTELLGDDEVTRRFRLWANSVIKKELVKRTNMSVGEPFLNDATEILEDLNNRTGRRYRPNPETLQMIRARMAEGNGVDDFKKVHQVMCGKWLDDAKMRDYLRPSTLYRAVHFSEYLALWVDKKVVNHRGTEKTESAEQLLKKREREKEGNKLIERLMAKAWWEFDSWAELMKWTVQFPDASSLAKYEMPERVRKMRTAPGMVMQVLGGHSPEWAEAEYGEMKRYFKKEEKRERDE